MSSHDEIISGLTASPAAISPKYFYDARGSALFDAITQLPEYYPTRTEMAVMRSHATDIAAHVGSGVTLIELGAGSCAKARLLSRCIQPSHFVGVDISADHLHEAIEGMRAEFTEMAVHAVVADINHAVELPADIPRTRRLVFYPGSSIGNFDPPHALALLQRMRALMDADGALLIGIDLHKDLAILEAAYNDAAGVTAAFNCNVLEHVNRLIGSDFDSAQWQHRSFFNAKESRIEMHLEALADATVCWPGGARAFAAGERIHTENSYKYALHEFTEMLSAAGFAHTRSWTDDRNWFAVVCARP